MEKQVILNIKSCKECPYSQLVSLGFMGNVHECKLTNKIIESYYNKMEIDKNCPL